MTVASFFAGCGGLDLGFEQAKFHVAWAVDSDSHCRSTYIRNHPHTQFVLADVQNLTADDIPDCDGFVGGPPCQSWSIGGKQKGLDDKRGQLFLKYIELIQGKKPKFFVIENVKGMLDDKFRVVFEDFSKRLELAGYDVKWSLLDAADFRVPQNRERLFFVGFRKELHVKFAFPQPTCVTPITLEQAISDISEKPQGYSGIKSKDSDIVPNTQRLYPNHDVLTSAFGPFYMRGNRRRGWKQPSFTINATADYAPLHPSSPKMKYFGRERWGFQQERINEYRRLSVRECARIQTFPDKFIFEYDDIRHAYKMIGNAVPPRLGRAIAESILSAFGHTDTSEAKHIPTKEAETILVGYYKGAHHKQLILNNRLYYIRADGRKGSMFKEECTFVPTFLLLHHKNEAEIYELEKEEPVLADASFLKTLGFKTSGDHYLCFRLKRKSPTPLHDIDDQVDTISYAHKSFAPYITTMDKVLSKSL